MASFTIETDRLGTMLDGLLNGDEQGPYAFVLVVCKDFEVGRRGVMRCDATITSNISPNVAAKLLRAGAAQVEQEADDA